MADSTDLTQRNSFGVAASCRSLLLLQRPQQCRQLAEIPEYNEGPVLMLGGGSNVLFTANYPGLVILNRLVGRQILDATPGHAHVRVMAGENWHELVRWSLDQGLCGLENLSLIPGLAGAAPMQNIGAYGVELSDVLESVEVWDRQAQSFHMLKPRDLLLGYRDSVFKQQPERWFVISLTLRLSRKPRLRLGYAGLREELDSMGIAQPTPLDVSDAVIRIRQRKLHDPAETGNAGSFFKNPVVSMLEAEQLHRHHPDLPSHPAGADRAKLSAAWLIEQCGWKGHRDGDAGVSEKHALVLVNHGQASGADIWRLAQAIRDSVKQTFGITLQPEPRILP